MRDAGLLRLTLVRLLREAAWAPIAVLILNAVIVRTPYARDLYSLLHLFGGAALAFFFFQAIRIAGDLWGTLRPLAHHLFAFALTCTAALLWEIAEFAFDQIAGTRLQEGLSETMGDLIFDMVGAGGSLALIAYLPRITWR